MKESRRLELQAQLDCAREVTEAEVDEIIAEAERRAEEEAKRR